MPLRGQFRVNVRSEQPVQAVSEADIFLLARRSQPQADWLKCLLKFPSLFRIFLQKIYWHNCCKWPPPPASALPHLCWSLKTSIIALL